jgi:RNA-binding protein Musashi
MSQEDFLYSDLYGADDPELTGTPQKEELLTLPDENTTSSSTPQNDTTAVAPPKATTSSNTAPSAASPGASSNSIKKPEAIPTYETSTPATVGSAIPTYNSSDNSAYSYKNAQQNGGAGGDASRSVRPSEMRDEGKMFVGGLNWDTTDESLRNYFSEFGKVDACTIMRDAQGRSRGFAFLTFEDPAAVNAVMVREHFLDGKIIDPKRAIPRQEHHKTQKLFVGGLPPSVTTESMREFFMQYGKVVDATVMVDRDSSRSKGFGFVTFEDATGVEKLLALGNLEIDGKMIEVKLAQPRGARRDDAGNNFNQNTRTDNNAMAQGGNFTPFDPQAMANLYQRMFQFAQAGGSGWNQGGGGGGGMMGGSMGSSGMPGMNPMMMNPMMGGMGRGMMGMGMGGGMMGGMGGGMGSGMGSGMGGMGGGMGGGRGQNMGMSGMASGNIPGGPRAMRGNQQQIPNQQTPAGAGPTRFTTKGQHSFRPY